MENREKYTKEILDRATAILEEREVQYLHTERELEELTQLLSNLEDAILILPLLGLRQEYEDVMADKMIMYDTQIQAFRALCTFLAQKIIEPNKLIITRRGNVFGETEQEITKQE